MSKRTRLILKWAGYPLYAIVVFLVALYATFPYGKLKTRIETQLSRPGEREVTIGDLGPSPLLGLSAERVVVRVKRNPPAGAPGAAPALATGATADGKAGNKGTYRRFVLDQVTVNSGLIAILSGNVDVSFDVEGMGGNLEGRYQRAKKVGWSLEATASKLKMTRMPFLGDAIGLPLAGTLSAEVDLNVPKHSLSNARGSVEIEVDKCALGDGKKKLKVPGNPMLAAGITMPKVDVGRLGGRIKVDKGVAKLQNFTSKGRDIEMSLEGSFTLHNQLAFSNAQAYLRFKISPELIKKDPKFELLQSGLANAKRNDGFFGMQIMGSLKKPRFIPSRLGPSKLQRGPGPPGAPGRPFQRFPAQGRLMRTEPAVRDPG
jgi:type II secretion system protein N